MPVDVTMHDPRASVVGAEADSDVVSSCTNADDIALDGVDEVIAAATSATDDTKRVTVQVDWVLERVLVRAGCWEKIRGAHRATDRTAWHRELNDLVARKLVNGTAGEEVLGSACTAENLEKYGDGRLVKSITVDLELESGEVKHHVEVDVDISGADSGDSRGSRISEGVETGLEEEVAAG